MRADPGRPWLRIGVMVFLATPVGPAVGAGETARNAPAVAVEAHDGAADAKAACASRSTPPDARIAACTRVLAARPGAAEAALVHNRRGNAYLAKKDYDGAIADYDAAIRLDPKGAVPYANRGLTWQNKGDKDRAIADYDAAIRLDPKHAVAFNNRGNIYADRKDYDRAIADYGEAIRINPKYAMAFSNRGLAWKNKGDYDRAFADFAEAIRRDPKYAASYNHRGNARADRKDYDGAIADFGAAIRIDPKYAAAFNNRGNAWRAKGDRDRAIADYSEAIRLDPKHAFAFHNRALTLRNKGEHDRAIADYDAALRLDPGYVAALTGRGLAYEARKDIARARADFGAALQLPAKYDNAKWAHNTARARLAALPAPLTPGPAKSAAPPAPATSATVTAGGGDGRIALVIGNGAYRKAPALPNPPNDAGAVAALLRGMGFTVISAVDLDNAGMGQVMLDFVRRTAGARVALVFYAGHAVQLDGRNYLVPIDAGEVSRATAPIALFDLDRLLTGLDDEARANVIILDACRDNPLESRIATRSTSRGGGLAAYSNVASGMLIAFATAPGQTAEDGDGVHSPFTTALLKHLPTPRLEINQMLNRVRADVREATRKAQTPWTNSSLMGDVYLVR